MDYTGYFQHVQEPPCFPDVFSAADCRKNFNGEVDALVGEGLLSRVRALVDVRFSNSMIESW